MKKVKNIIATFALFLFTTVVSAQVSASFETRNGYQYAVITNSGSNTVYVAWRCINYQLGQYRDGSINLKGGYETCIGPNIGWNWQPGEELIYQVSGGNSYNISFRGKTHGDGNPPHSGSDGYIYMGTSIKYSGNSYRLYKKEGHKYIYDRVDGWIRLD